MVRFRILPIPFRTFPSDNGSNLTGSDEAEEFCCLGRWLETEGEEVVQHMYKIYLPAYLGTYNNGDDVRVRANRACTLSEIKKTAREKRDLPGARSDRGAGDWWRLRPWQPQVYTGHLRDCLF